MNEYYEKHAKQYVKETFEADMQESYREFLPGIPERGRILDLGSGSGRDTCRFAEMGYQVTALEPASALCKEIRKVFSGEVVCASIQNYHPEEVFDGIWACASLLHLTEQELLDFIQQIHGYVKEGGVIYLSGKNGIATGYVPDGRYFLEFTEELVERMLTVNPRLKPERIWYSGDCMGREGFCWMNLVFRYSRGEKD